MVSRRLLLVPLVMGLAACVDRNPLAPTGPAESILPTQALEPPPLGGCVDGIQPSGALYEICFPFVWNGELVVWAHGYVSPLQPLAVPDDAVEGTPIREIVRGLGYAYAATSYRRNGLVATDAVLDLKELIDIFSTRFGEPGRTYGVGASEGALAMTLALEQSGSLVDGGLVICGPLGSFRGQVNYFGDTRVLFDYFFPGILPGSPIDIPGELQANWATVYVPRVTAALASNPSRTAELIRTARIAVDPNDPTTAVGSVLAALWYNVFATNDARAVLGGNPFDNRTRWYWGSSNDFRLNLLVRRFSASTAALAAMQAYETTGRLKRPLQGLHTLYDPVVPYWHQPVYALKAIAAGAGLRHLALPSEQYGHCSVTREEALASFALLVLRVTGQDLLTSRSVFEGETEIAGFLRLAREHGAAPTIR